MGLSVRSRLPIGVFAAFVSTACGSADFGAEMDGSTADEQFAVTIPAKGAARDRPGWS